MQPGRPIVADKPEPEPKTPAQRRNNTEELFTAWSSKPPQGFDYLRAKDDVEMVQTGEDVVMVFDLGKPSEVRRLNKFQKDNIAVIPGSKQVPLYNLMASEKVVVGNRLLFYLHLVRLYFRAPNLSA